MLPRVSHLRQRSVHRLQVDGLLWAVVGSWGTYEVSVWRLSPGSDGPGGAMEAVLRLPTTHPRSLLVHQLAGAAGGGGKPQLFLLAASASGEVVVCPLFHRAAGIPGITLGAALTAAAAAAAFHTACLETRTGQRAAATRGQAGNSFLQLQGGAVRRQNHVPHTGFRGFQRPVTPANNAMHKGRSWPERRNEK